MRWYPDIWMSVFGKVRTVLSEAYGSDLEKCQIRLQDREFPELEKMAL
jgi:hypothetical protein